MYTRTGGRFFNDETLEMAFLERLRAAMTAAGFWDEFDTTWGCLDCELLPWSAKAQELLHNQHAAVGAAGRASLPVVIGALQEAVERLPEDVRNSASDTLRRLNERNGSIGRYVTAYRHYCWPVNSLDDLKLAPFHLLATEGKVHVNQNHVWHMDNLAKICRAAPQFLTATPYKVVDLLDPASEADGIAWWLGLTSNGGEGMVVKPFDFVCRGKRGLVQPSSPSAGDESICE